MNYNDEDNTSLLCAIVIGGTILLALILSCFGCSSVRQCPECIPTTEIVEVVKPVRVCPPPPDVPVLELPEYPNAPSELTDEALKEWYAGVVATVKTREVILQQRIDLLLEILSGYDPISE